MTGLDTKAGATYACVDCARRCRYAEVRNTGRCPACGGGLARSDGAARSDGGWTPRPAARASDPDPIRALRLEVQQLRRANDGRSRQRSPNRRRTSRRQRSRGRLRLMLAAAVIAVVTTVVVNSLPGGSRAFALPSKTTLAGLSVRGRIVAIASSQVGYGTEPGNSYCNKFSAYWNAGSSNCPGGELSEQWCADFAAWAWKRAGLKFPYGYAPGDINAGAVSFYSWGVANGRWHPAGGGYVARPGDVAVYGLSLGPDPSAAHVAIVSSDRVHHGPDVINGDGDRTGFSVVEAGTDQLRADTGHGHDAPLAGYVSPP